MSLVVLLDNKEIIVLFWHTIEYTFELSSHRLVYHYISRCLQHDNSKAMKKVQGLQEAVKWPKEHISMSRLVTNLFLECPNKSLQSVYLCI